MQRGRSAHGVGSFGINVAQMNPDGTATEHQLAQPGGSPAFIDDDAVIGQAEPSPGAPWRVLSGPASGPLTQLWPDWMSNVCLAGGGTIAAGWTGHGTRVVNRAILTDLTSGQLSLPNGYAEVRDLMPVDVDRETGSVVFTDQVAFVDLLVYHADNPILSADGTRLPPDRVIHTGTGFVNVRSLGDKVVWRGVDGKAHSEDATIVLRQGESYNQSLLVKDWIVYLNGDGKLIARPVNNIHVGHVVNFGIYSFDAEVQPNGMLRVCGSLDAGESVAPGSTRFVDMSMTALENIDPPPYVIPVISNFIHQAWTATFFADKTGPGSACILGNQQDWRTDAPDGAQIIVSPTSLAVAKPPRERFLGIYNEVRSGLTLALAQQHGVPLFVCHDAPGPFDVNALKQMRPGIDWALLECYLLPGETVAEACTRWSLNLKTLLAAWKGHVGVVWQDYTQAWHVPIQRLLDAQAYISTLINSDPRVQFVGCFAWRRPDGCVGPPWTSAEGEQFFPSPELAECVRRIAAASPGVPEEIPMNPPQVVVDAFSLDELKNGREFVGHDPQNPQIGTRCRVWVENGSMFMEISYPALGSGFTGRTFKVRPVK